MVQGVNNELDQNDFRGRLSKLHAIIDTVADSLEKVDGFPMKA